MARDVTLAPPTPRELQVEVTGACNLGCRMCLVRYAPRIGRRSGALPLAAFHRLLDELPDLERVTLQGLGEPLLAPGLLEMVEACTARGIAVGFNTNATLLTRPVAERLVATGLSWLHVSLDGATAATYEGVRDGARFDVVCANLAGLLAARRAAGAERPRVLIVFVAMRRNVGDLAQLVQLAHGWGVDGVRVQNLSHSFSDTDPAGQYAPMRAFAGREALWGDEGARGDPFAEARALAAELGVDLRLPALEPEPPPAPVAGRPGCDWPWRSSYVTHRGEVQPCCMVMGSDRATLGQLDDDDGGFGEIWTGEAYAEFRRRLAEPGDPPDVCRGCSFYRGVF
jgi:radical SAM protein with 4Fe4S-binding SPASM domain